MIIKVQDLDFKGYLRGVYVLDNVESVHYTPASNERGLADCSEEEHGFIKNHRLHVVSVIEKDGRLIPNRNTRGEKGRYLFSYDKFQSSDKNSWWGFVRLNVVFKNGKKESYIAGRGQTLKFYTDEGKDVTDLILWDSREDNLYNCGLVE